MHLIPVFVKLKQFIRRGSFGFKARILRKRRRVYFGILGMMVVFYFLFKTENGHYIILGNNLKSRNYYNENLLPLCEFPPKGLKGRKQVELGELSFQEIATKYPYFKSGHFKPWPCKAIQKIAVIIPYRDREKQLKIFLNNMIPKLYRQQLDFTIYVVEQTNGTSFNRGMGRNIGFREASLDFHYDCYIFHDVDVYPEDDRNFYICGTTPRHLAGQVKKANMQNYKLLYETHFGGVTAFTSEQYIKVNGFSNQFFMWGTEDDELFCRLVHKNMSVERPYPNVSHTLAIGHHRDPMDWTRLDILYSILDIYDEEGLNSLKYKRLQKEDKPLYKWILVEINRTQVEQDRLNNPKTRPLNGWKKTKNGLRNAYLCLYNETYRRQRLKSKQLKFRRRPDVMF